MQRRVGHGNVVCSVAARPGSAELCPAADVRRGCVTERPDRGALEIGIRRGAGSLVAPARGSLGPCSRVSFPGFLRKWSGRSPPSLSRSMVCRSAVGCFAGIPLLRAIDSCALPCPGANTYGQDVRTTDQVLTQTRSPGKRSADPLACRADGASRRSRCISGAGRPN
jgi:hypothetical protein